MRRISFSPRGKNKKNYLRGASRRRVLFCSSMEKQNKGNRLRGPSEGGLVLFCRGKTKLKNYFRPGGGGLI